MPGTPWASAEEYVLLAAVLAGDAAGDSRMESCAAVAAALTGRTTAAVRVHVRRLEALGRVPLMRRKAGSAGAGAIVAAEQARGKAPESSVSGVGTVAVKSRGIILEASAAPPSFGGDWTASEDDAVVAAVLAGDASGAARAATCKTLAKSMLGRSASAILQRVKKLMVSGRLPAAPLARSRSHAPNWTATEDDAVVAAVLAGNAAGATRKFTCEAAAEVMPGRTAIAICARSYFLAAAGRLEGSRQLSGQKRPHSKTA